MQLAFVPASYIQFVVKEREVSAKHQQLISGVSIPAYWLSSWVYDALSYLPTAFLCVAVCYGFQISQFASTDSHIINSLVLVFLLYGWSRYGKARFGR